MEFQFGTNWSHFSRFAGGVIGQTLAMEGCFAFFLESAFLGPVSLWREAPEQRPALVLGADGISGLVDVGLLHHRHRRLDAASRGLRTRGRWLSTTHQLLATRSESVGVVAVRAQHERRGHYRSVRDGAVGAFYLLWGKFQKHARIFVRVGVIAGLIFSVLQLFPTGDGQGRMIAENQPVTLAAMEALFVTQPGAPLVILGQPNVDERKIDNPIEVPEALSFLTYRAWKANVQGLDAFPQNLWPDNVALLYYSYHIMVGLGTIFIAIMLVAAFLLWRGKLFSARWMLWILVLALPFPYIANTAGWITAELGRQPWLVYGLMRTSAGYSKLVSAGNGMFTLLGFMGMYMVLGILFLFLVRREIEQGPEAEVITGH
jgi:cytochrome d ubiquinol oxidase subunit I